MPKFTLNKSKHIEEMARPSEGMNLWQPGANTEGFYLDRAKQGRGPHSWMVNWSTSLADTYLNAAKEPTSLPAGVTSLMFVVTLQPVATAATITAVGASVAGTYRLKWTKGPTAAQVSASSGVTLTTIGTREVNVTIPDMGNYALTFSGLDGADVTTLPDYPSFVRTTDVARFEAGEIFTQEAIDFLTITDANGNRVFEEFRTMQAQGIVHALNTTTDLSATKTWADRRTLSDASWAGEMPIEVIVALANASGLNPYICIHQEASDDYIIGIATYVRDNLDPSLCAIVEYSNEGWNFQFGYPANWLNAMGQAFFGTSVGDEYAHYYGYRVVQMAKLFDSVYGAQRNYKIVLAWQSTSRAQANAVLLASRWQTLDPTNYIAPAYVVDEVRTAPYFGYSINDDGGIWPLVQAGVQADLTNYIVPLAQAALQTTFNDTAAWVAILAAYGLPLKSYENGQHLEWTASPNRNLFYTDLAVPTPGSFTIGETITQAVTGAHAVLLSVNTFGSTTYLRLDTEATADSPAFDTTHDVTGGTSLVTQTPTAVGTDKVILDYNIKPNVVEMVAETVNNSPEFAAVFTAHMDGQKASGMRGYNLYAGYGYPSKYGDWGYRHTLAANTNRSQATVTWAQNNPRWWAEPDVSQRRRLVSWP